MEEVEDWRSILAVGIPVHLSSVQQPNLALGKTAEEPSNAPIRR